MKRCVGCGEVYCGERWRCPGCGREPAWIESMPAFAAGQAGSGGIRYADWEPLDRLAAKNFWFRGRTRLIAWALSHYFPGARSFLDIGAGTGLLPAALAALRPDLAVTAGEVSRAGLVIAARRMPRRSLMQFDARHVPFADEFDVLGAFDVLEHIDADEAVLREAWGALKPGGGLLITVPQHRWLWSAADDQAGHVRRYSAAGLRAKAERAGFRVLRMTSFVSLLLPAMMLSRLRHRSHYDLAVELDLPGWLNALFESTLDLERALIRGGVSLPAGGSLLLVAQKPGQGS